jgi:hypothetical protein
MAKENNGTMPSEPEIKQRLLKEWLQMGTDQRSTYEQQANREFHIANQSLLDDAGPNYTAIQDVIHTQDSPMALSTTSNTVIYSTEPSEYQGCGITMKMIKQMDDDVQRFNSSFSTMDNYQLAAVSGHLLGLAKNTPILEFNSLVASFVAKRDRHHILCFYKTVRTLIFVHETDMIVVCHQWKKQMKECGKHFSSKHFRAIINGTEYEFDSAKHIFTQMRPIWHFLEYNKHAIALQKKKGAEQHYY